MFGGLLACGLAAGCGPKVTSPKPSAGSVTPDLVCNAQLRTPVVLSGTGFTPMPVDTYSLARLVLPTVRLERATDATATVPFPDGADGGLVTWTGAESMTVVVTPELSVAAGPWDVVLTNPDGRGVARFSPGLTAVPPPKLASVAPSMLCDAQTSRTLVLAGEGFLSVGAAVPDVRIGTKHNADYTQVKATGCAAVDGTFAEGPVSRCTGLEVTMPVALLGPGDYPVEVTNPAPAGCRSTEAVTVRLAPPPTLTGLDRPSVCDAQGQQTVALAGSDFFVVGSTLPKVTIGTHSNADFTSVTPTGCAAVSWTLAEGAVQRCGGLSVVVPAGLFPPGQYPVAVENPPPLGCRSTTTVSLTVAPPPVVTGSVPATVCQGGGLVTLTGQGFQPTATVKLERADGGSPATTSVQVNDAGTQLTATFSSSTLGATFDVVVDNQDGCRDQPPHQTLTVVPGPVAFFADPEVAYNGIATRVTVYVTTLTWSSAGATATLTPHGATSPATVLTGLPVAGHPNRLQIVVPVGQAPGTYDLSVLDGSGCAASLANALTVTASTTISLASVTPAFGWTGSSTAVTVLRNSAAAAPNNEPLRATPRLFLNPSSPAPTDVAVQVQSVSFLGPDTLTAVVPANQAAKTYDLVVVNPNGTVGVLPSAFKVQSDPPPVVTAVTPASLLSGSSNALTITGTSFRPGATAKLSCNSGPSPTVTVAGNPSCTAAGCTLSGTVPSGLSVGATCIVDVANTDGSHFPFSAVGVTDTPGNLSSQRNGQNLTRPRRAAVASAGNATGASRFVYVVGGDSGSGGAGSPFSDVEMASVDAFGVMGAWKVVPRSSLATGRAFAGAATVGRYTYVFGGTDGATALKSAERAMILDPAEVPALDVNDIVPAPAGLTKGAWLYRVAAVFASSDADNPGGESLPSDELVVRVPDFPGHLIQVQLGWSAPADSAGTPLPNVVSYRVYRTPLVDQSSGQEVLVATVAAPTRTWTDDGTAATTSTQRPLPMGSLGTWKALPDLNAARQGHAAAAVVDPSDPTKVYVYALAGLSGGTTPSLRTSYEYLAVTLLPNGHQTVGPAWTTGSASLTGRWQTAAWVADRTMAPGIAAGTSYVYVGGGLDPGGGFISTVECGKVAAGGDLGTFTTEAAFTASLAGYSANAAAGTLFAWGGSGASPASDGHSAVIQGGGPGLSAGAWNSVGGINLGAGRYLAASTVQSAFFFVLGGAGTGSSATDTTLLMVW